MRPSSPHNDGAMKVGYLAPSVEGQSRAVTEALAVSGIDPETISYVEAHGTGRPVILLHGGLWSGEMFRPILPALAERHQVIAVDLQGHGRTADIDRPIAIPLMADDIGALIDHLGLDRPDVVGYSLGGGVAFHTASRYPAKVRRLVMASATIRPTERSASLDLLMPVRVS